MTSQRTLQEREESLTKAADKICRTMSGYDWFRCVDAMKACDYSDQRIRAVLNHGYKNGFDGYTVERREGVKPDKYIYFRITKVKPEVREEIDSKGLPIVMQALLSGRPMGFGCQLYQSSEVRCRN